MIRTHVQRLVEGRTLILVIAALAAAILLFARPAHADTFTVTNSNDDGVGSLRQAIEVANANAGADAIKFNIPGGGVKTIAPASELPEITGQVVIDGYSQPGTSPNSRSTGGLDTVILVELSGSGAGIADGLEVSAPNVVVRGLAINRFTSNGINISPGTGARIEGNFIGTDASGTLDRGNGDGVDVNVGGKNIIGGTTPASRNLISGNNTKAVELDSQGDNRVQGNLIGVQKDGTSFMGGSQVGVEILTSNNIIGGTEPRAGNVIANSFGSGVFVLGTGNRVSGNSIFGNGGLGIDLAGDGRTFNDPKDPDAGPNLRQNFPEITSAEKASSGTTTVKGTLDSTPSTRKKKKSFTIQFFRNPSTGDEGKTFLGQKKVTTNRQGKASFSFQTSRPISLGDRITATATGPGGTSEFSDPVIVKGAPQAG